MACVDWPSFGRCGEWTVVARRLLKNTAAFGTADANGNWTILLFKEGSGMLVLSRRQGQRIVIGNGITVTVLEVQGNRAKIGIEAPVDMPIRREELVRKGEAGWPALEYSECA